jgi:hypothetical protein
VERSRAERSREARAVERSREDRAVERSREAWRWSHVAMRRVVVDG